MNVRYRMTVLALLIISTFTFAQKSNSSSSSQYNLAYQSIYVSVATPPSAITDVAFNINQTRATLRGFVNPNGEATQAQFEYGLTTSYGQTTPLRLAGTGTSTVTFIDSVFGLTPNTLYHFRIKATNSSGTVFGSDKTFTTLANPPIVNIENATDILLESAVVRAQVNPNGAASTVFFEWGINGTPSGQSSPDSVGSGTSFVPVQLLLEPLNPNTTYYVVAIAENSGGTSVSDTAYFTTLASESEYRPDAYTVALFHFNEESGDLVQDYSENNNWSTSGSAPIVPGKYGRARSYNNATSFIGFTHINDYNFSGDFTLEAWVKPELFGINNLVVISKGDVNVASNEAYRLSVLSNGSIQLIINTLGSVEGRYVIVTDSLLVSDDEWHHIAATYNASTNEVKIYLNGIQRNVTTSGTPGPPVSSSAPLMIGLSSGSGLTKTNNLFFCEIDEVRLSNKVRTRSEFNLAGSISGVKFNDLNGNGEWDYGEEGIPNWKIVLFKPSAISASSSLDTAITDSTGYYSFENVPRGRYILGEVQQDDWVQTAPAGDVYRLEIKGSEVFTNMNFGNRQACRYLGGNPLVGSNWSCGHIPVASNGDPIILRGDSLNLDDTIISFFTNFHSLQIENGGYLSYCGSLPLHILRKLHIKENSTFQICPTPFSQLASGTNQVFLEGSLINNGTLLLGSSSDFIFLGNKRKVIASNVGFNELTNTVTKRTTPTTSSGNTFHNLLINGDSTFASGNIIVQNTLVLNYNLDPEPEDTIIIQNSAPLAISGPGKIPDGSVKRMIQQSSTAAYRFSDPATYLQFDGNGDYPDSITITTEPSATPRAFTALKWEVFDTTSTVDTTANTITVTGISKFSKWTMGTSGSGNLKRSNSETPRAGNPKVSRQYSVKAEGGSGFSATLSMSYEQSEFSGTGEDSLRILRGPYLVDTLLRGWNMISTPVVAEDNNVIALFPSELIASQAFEFVPGSGYQPASQLEFGKGYWLKFSDGVHAVILGDDRETTRVAVQEGWNLIGSVSYPLLANTVTAEGTTIISQFYRYRNGYLQSDTLKPLMGYWVKVSGNGVLKLDASAEMSKTLSLNSRLNEMNVLIISDADGNEQPLYFGTSKHLDQRYYELPPLPPRGVFDARFASGMMLELADEKISKNIPIQLSSAKVPVRITWKIKEMKTATLKIENKEIPLTADGSVEISDISKVIALQLSPAQNSEVPQEFALYQNYPNPFNPSTTMRFDLAADAIVTLKVYNILGQEVATVIDNKVYKAGRYVEQFSNSNLASGVYFYRLTTMNTSNTAMLFHSVKKMVLIR